MSNIEADPVEIRCAEPHGGPDAHAAVEVITSREVPLGGPRAMMVRRTLPQRQRSLIGAWCFADHYGPDDVGDSGGMDVAPHPHTGLQTVSWLFTGEIEHRDSLGKHAFVRPGELNLMTGGRGICHSEVSTPQTTVLHGVQLWVALPDAHRDADRDFVHYAPEPVRLDGALLRVFLGDLAGSTSPVATFTPLLGAEITLEPGTTLELDVDPAMEHGLLVDAGPVALCGANLARGELGYLPTGHQSLTIHNPGPEPARLILLGGEPFGEEIVMWWNFVGRTHEDIAAARAEWQERTERFGHVEGYIPPHDGAPEWLPAPPLPNARMTPRRNPS